MTRVYNVRLAIRQARLPFVLVMLVACAGRPRDPILDAYPRDVVGFTSVTYYDVHGRTVAELRADMRRQGPKIADTNFVAETRSPMRWQWHTRPEGIASCSMKDAHVFMNAQILLPRWTPPADTEPGLIAEWTRFIAALETHEAGHKNISAKGASELTQRLMALSGPCSTISDRAGNIGRSISARVEDEQRQYDAETRHGILQGTSFGIRRPFALPTGGGTLAPRLGAVLVPLATSMERVWQSLPASYRAIGLAITATDSVSHVVSYSGIVHEKIGDSPLSAFFDCGGPTTDVSLILATQLTSRTVGETVVTVVPYATVRSNIGATVECRPTAALGRQILQALRVELAR